MILKYLKPLEHCKLENGRLYVEGLSSLGYYNLAMELRKAIINYEVPHWKIIALHIKLGKFGQFVDFVSKPNGINRSYAELVPVLKGVAAANGGGEPLSIKAHLGQTANCFYKKPGDLSFICSTENEVTTRNGAIHYESFRGKEVQFLTDVDILKSESSILQCIMYRGTGVVDFKEASKIISVYDINDAVCRAANEGNQKLAYCPMTAIFDLSQFVLVKQPTMRDEHVQLYYKTDIDESVLQSIFQQYGSEIE